tara:strand:- start:144 stop:1064 length:921 start_codon:yes stop_codon:yes gene_type:complete
MKTWTLLHLVLSVLHVAAGVYVLSALGDGILKTEQDVYVTKPKLITTDDVFHVVLEQEHLFRVSPIAIHAVVSLATGASHIIAAVIYACESEGVLDERPNKLRWTEYAITATAMTLSGYISVGQGDIYVLVNITLLGILLQLCGYFIEVKETKNTWKIFFWLGCFVEFAIVVPLTAWTVSLNIFENAGLYAAWGAYIIYYSLFPLNAYHDAKHKYEKDHKFTVTDKYYVILSFTSKMALFWITVGALMSNVSEDSEVHHWENIIIAACIVPACMVLASWYILRKDYIKETKNTNTSTISTVKSLMF